MLCLTLHLLSLLLLTVFLKAHSDTVAMVSLALLDGKDFFSSALVDS